MVTELEEQLALEETEPGAIMEEVIYSMNIGELAKALAAATLEFEVITKEGTNPYFKSKYAELSAIIEATSGPLAKQGIVVMQPPIVSKKTAEAGCYTHMIHASGAWMKAKCLLPVSKWDAHGIGSAITYSRRYSLQAFLNVSGEEDDDANAAVQPEVKKQPRPPVVAPVEAQLAQARREQTKTAGPSVSEQRQAMFIKNFNRVARLDRPGHPPKTDEEIGSFLQNLGYERLHDVPAQHYQTCMNWAGTSGDQP
jgi:hypothetical protein